VWKLNKTTARATIVSWNERFHQLEAYKKDHGDCKVPQKYSANQKLATWVKTQRTVYKKQGNCTNKLTKEQINRLEGIGFEWAGGVSRGRKPSVGWNERFHQLEAYKKEHGDCDVPAKYKVNPQLATWVVNQRAVYNKTKKGARALSDEQINRLERIGFEWVLSRGRRPAVVKVSDVEGATSLGDTQILIPSLPPLPEVSEAVADIEGSPSGEDEETGGDTSPRDTQMMIPMPPLPPVAEDMDNTNTFGGEPPLLEDTLGDESVIAEHQRDNQQGDGDITTRVNGSNSSTSDTEAGDEIAHVNNIEEEEFANDGSSFFMDEDGNIDSTTNVSASLSTVEQGRKAGENQQDFAQIASLLQPDIVDLKPMKILLSLKIIKKNPRVRRVSGCCTCCIQNQKGKVR